MPTAEAIASIVLSVSNSVAAVRSNIMPSVDALSAMVLSLSESMGTIRCITNNLIPGRFQDYLFSALCTLIRRNCFPTVSIYINESGGPFANQLYDAAEIYLCGMLPPTVESLTVAKFETEKRFRVTIDGDEEVVDKYQGIKITWRRRTHQVERENFISSRRASLYQSFEVRFHRKHAQMVIDSYFPFIVSESRAIKENSSNLKVHKMRDGDLRGRWIVVNVNRPATFTTLAMDPDVKKELVDDLERFLRIKDFYKRSEKSWKRVYVLHGPPGTGKTSLVEAMAELIQFSVYIVELTKLRGGSKLTKLRRDSKLKNLLMGTSEQSIIVFEHKEQGEQARQTMPLSQVLSFINEMPFSFREARIFIFITDDRELLDSSFLHTDLCIHMSYLKPSAFNILVSNRLGIEDHELFKEIQQLLTRVEVTPAQVIEELNSSNDAGVSLTRVIELLRKKVREQPEACGSVAAIV